MKAMKICLVVGVALAISSQAWAVSIPAGPVVFKTTTWDMGTLYPGGPVTYDSTDGDPNNDVPSWPSAGAIGSPGADPGEDVWGLIYVETISTGSLKGLYTFGPNFQPESQFFNDTLSPDRELVGIFYGGQDIAVDVAANGDTDSDVGGDLKFVIYEQPRGTFTKPSFSSPLGGSNRVSSYEFAGVGVNADTDPSVQVWLSGYMTAGFFNLVAADPNLPKLTTSFRVDSATEGNAQTVLSVQDFDIDGNGSIDAWEMGSQNTILDTDIYQSPLNGNTGDLYLNMDTTSNNVTNDPNFQNGFNWTATNNDEIDAFAVPEPVTMLGVFMAVGGLGGYIRKRRMA